MDGRRRWIGFLILGLAAWMLLGGMGGRGWGGHGGYQGYGYGPAPQWQAPPAPGYGQPLPADPGYARGYQDGMWASRSGPGGYAGYGPPPWLKPLLLIGLALLAFKIFGRRRWQGGWRACHAAPEGAQPGQGGQTPEDRPGPEQPPYTGQTKNL